MTQSSFRTAARTASSGSTRRRGSRAARARDARRRARRMCGDRADVVVTNDGRRAPRRRAGGEAVDGSRRRPGRGGRGRARGLDGAPVLVVNADVPASSRTTCGRCRRRRARGGRARRGGGRDDERARAARASAFAPLYGPGARAVFATTRRSSRPRRGRNGRFPTSPTTSTRCRSRAARRSAPAADAGGALLRSRNEGRAPLRRRRRGALRARPGRRRDPAGVTVVGNVGDDLEVLGLAVSPDLDSILYALAGLHDEERGGAAPARRGTRSRP